MPFLSGHALRVLIRLNDENLGVLFKPLGSCRMNVQLAEAPAEVLMLIHIDRLFTKEDHEVLQQRSMNRIELLIAEPLRQIDTANFGANVGSDLAHLHGLIAHRRTPYVLGANCMKRAKSGTALSSAVERASMVAEPEADQRAPALGLGPVFEAGALVTQPTIVQDLDLTGLEVELLVKRGIIDDGRQRIERGAPKRIEALAREVVALLDEIARQPGLKPTAFECKDRSADGHLGTGRVLALAIEMVRSVESLQELRMVLLHEVVRGLEAYDAAYAARFRRFKTQECHIVGWAEVV